MNLFGVSLGRPGEPELDRLLRQAVAAEPTYDHVGSTLQPEPRPTEHRQQVDLGDSPHAFDRGAEALRQWRPHHELGATVFPADAPIEVGVTVLVVLPVGPGAVVVPNRAVVVVDEPDRFGFAYGTLPGHAEQGEESFLVERGPDGKVTATIRVDARPATLGARLVSFALPAIQRRAVTRYLRGIERHVRQWPS